MPPTTTRMTKQRNIILSVLRSVKSHPTADELYELVRKQLPRISLGTVYRNLEYLFNAGVIRRLERSGTQMRFDGDVTPHSHIRCKQCGCIGDVFSTFQVALDTIECTQGFVVQNVDLEFLGLCPGCSTIM